MRKIIYTSCLLLFAQVFGMKLSFGQSIFEDAKKEIHSFKSHPGMELEIENKYGNVNVESWDEDSVRVEIEVQAKSKKAINLSKMLDMVEISVVEGADFIVVKTEWGKHANVFERGAMDVKKSFGSDQLEVHYQVFLPKGIRFRLDNRFGNVYLPVLEEKLYLNVSHGDVRMKAAKEVVLDHKFGKLRAPYIEELEGNLLQVKMDVEQVDKAKLKIVASDLEIGTCAALSLETKNGEVEIEQLGAGRLDASFSDVRIEELTGDLKANTLYGDLEVETVTPAVKHVYLNGSYTECMLTFDPELHVQYTLEVESPKNTDIQIPASRLSGAGGEMPVASESNKVKLTVTGKKLDVLLK